MTGKVGVEKPGYGPQITPGHTSPPRPSPAPAPEAPTAPTPREVRALWISRFDLGSPPVKRSRVEALINKAADAGFNMVLMQVRATGDAYYASAVEPWSYRLTSARVSDLGRNPGWDPLAVAVETAHKRGIELHAYLNAFTFWECDRGAPPHTAPEHPYWKLAGYEPGEPSATIQAGGCTGRSMGRRRRWAMRRRARCRARSTCGRARAWSGCTSRILR